ncbi:MAG: ribosomal-processing cysteine protease Prp [Clostridia bacterium]|nr:ribosomal-processing cysteine protease Prp [Clostridia bacterium]
MGFVIRGHDDPDGEGISLPCAAVSSAVYLTVNTITDVCGATPLVLEEANGWMSLRLSAKDAALCQSHLEGLRLHLSALSNDYETITLTEVSLPC